jgi:N-acetyl-anhydromuramyl-L-alanine amidase AmpD
MRVAGIPFVQGRNDYPDMDGKKFGIAIHNTSNDASDTAEAAYATRRTDGVSSHFYCDQDSVTQSLDTDVRAGHAGSRIGNDNAISVEITGANAWSRSTWLSSVAWDALGRVLAQVCTHHGIAVRRASVTEMIDNPKVKAFYSHDDMRRAWGGTTHTDPGPNFPWDRLFAAVNAALSLTPPTGADDMTPDQAGLLANTERILSAICTRFGAERGPGESEDRERIVLVQPWTGGPAEIPNPADWLIKQASAATPGEVPDGEVTLTVPEAAADRFVTLLRDLLGRPSA